MEGATFTYSQLDVGFRVNKSTAVVEKCSGTARPSAGHETRQRGFVRLCLVVKCEISTTRAVVVVVDFVVVVVVLFGVVVSGAFVVVVVASGVLPYNARHLLRRQRARYHDVVAAEY